MHYALRHGREEVTADAEITRSRKSEGREALADVAGRFRVK
jgi:hypothetical protein